MRTILFRGKRIDNGEWVEGDLITLVTPEFKPSESALILPKNSYSFNDTISCLAKSVGQFTGLTDRNGKMIFEGDVLTCDEYLVVIQFTGGQFVGRNDNYSISETQNRNWLSWEIIGNIHDNQELIKQ